VPASPKHRRPLAMAAVKWAVKWAAVKSEADSPVNSAMNSPEKRAVDLPGVSPGFVPPHLAEDSPAKLKG
jgi:hypothetical protein